MFPGSHGDNNKGAIVTTIAAAVVQMSTSLAADVHLG